MTKNHKLPSSLGGHSVNEARTRWLEASKRASEIAMELFQPGDGYGDLQARDNDRHRLETARSESERLFREYHDLDRREVEHKMSELQRSQTLATWASFLVAAVIAVATVIEVLR